MNRVCLIVMDGWGVNPKKEGNAVAAADTPNLRLLAKDCPYTTIEASGMAVGLPEGQMGNSEVGHLTLGSGRVIYQELTRINKAVKDGELEENCVLRNFIDNVKDRGGTLHLMGLVSDGGVHSHNTHLYELIRVAFSTGLENIFVHAFLDGRDTPPASGEGFVTELVERMEEIGAGKIATVSGRFYAMDRDKRWERVSKAWDAIVDADGVEAEDAIAAVEGSYRAGKTDEFMLPAVVRGYGGVEDGDGVLFFNFRADRARELSSCFLDRGFDGFNRGRVPDLTGFVTMTEYDSTFDVPVLFPPQEIKNLLGEVLSRNGICQFRVSETEKYAHVTFFFNGGVEKPYTGEERHLIPSVKDVPTYDLAPGMRAAEIAESAVEKIEEGRCAFILMNFANGDMVGHTGVIDAAVEACEAVDRAVGRVVASAMEHGWSVIITSDHGNSEQMIDYRTGEPHTAHTTNPVPFIIAGEGMKGVKLRDGAGLKDVAPTVLKIMGVDKPEEMEGEPLF